MIPKKVSQDFSIQFPVHIYEAFLGLSERWLMTPTYLSGMVMYAILPAKFLVKKINH